MTITDGDDTTDTTDTTGIEPATDTRAIDPERVAHARARLPSPDAAVRLTGLLSMMADPVRLRLIYALDVSEELCVGDLALALGVSEDSVSYALRLLRAAGLLVTRKDGRVVYNRLADDFPEPLRAYCLGQLVALTHRPGDEPDGTTAPVQRNAPTSHLTECE